MDAKGLLFRLNRKPMRESGGSGVNVDAISDDGPTDGLRFHDQLDNMLPFSGWVERNATSGPWSNGRWAYELSGSDLTVTDTITGAQGKLLDFSDRAVKTNSL